MINRFPFLKLLMIVAVALSASGCTMITSMRNRIFGVTCTTAAGTGAACDPCQQGIMGGIVSDGEVISDGAIVEGMHPGIITDGSIHVGSSPAGQGILVGEIPECEMNLLPLEPAPASSAPATPAPDKYPKQTETPAKTETPTPPPRQDTQLAPAPRSAADPKMSIPAETPKPKTEPAPPAKIDVKPEAKAEPKKPIAKSAPGSLSLDVMTAKSSVKVGETINFEIDLENKGASPIGRTTIRATLSANLSPETVTPEGRATIDKRKNMIIFDDILDFKPMPLNFTVTAKALKAGGNGKITVEVSSPVLGAETITQDAIVDITQ